MRLVIDVKEDKRGSNGFLRELGSILGDVVKGYVSIFTGPINGTPPGDKPNILHWCPACQKYHSADKAGH